MAEAAGAAWRQFRLERKLFWRNPSAAFFDIAFPLIFLALFGAIFAGDEETLNVIVPGLAGMATVSSTFTALAYRVTFRREDGTLKRVRGTPLRPASYLGGLFGNAIANAAIQLTIFVFAAKVVFGVEWPSDWAKLVVFALVGIVCFGALGVALSHAIPNADSATAYVNAIFLPLILISGVFFDVDDAPSVLHDIAAALPLTHLIQGLQGEAWSHLGVIAVWGALGVALAVRGFSWEARRS